MDFKMSESLRNDFLKGAAASVGGCVELRGKGKQPYLKFDEIVVTRKGPAYWSAEIRWRGRSVGVVTQSIFIEESASISFRCVSGRIPFSLETN